MACDKCRVASTASVFSRYECGADSAISWQFFQLFFIIKAVLSTSLSEIKKTLVKVFHVGSLFLISIILNILSITQIFLLDNLMFLS